MSSDGSPLVSGPVPAGRYSGPDQTDDYRTVYPWERFRDKTLRRRFIRNVYLLLSLQLAAVSGMTAVGYFSEPVKGFLNRKWINYISYIALLALYLTLVCLRDAIRRLPFNIIAVLLFTPSLGFAVAASAAVYELESVLLGVAVLTLSCLMVSLLSLWSKFDYVQCVFMFPIILFCLSCHFFLVIILYFSVGNFDIWQLVYSASGSLICIIYLSYSTNAISNGAQYIYGIDPEEYTTGSLLHYTQFYQIIFNILTFLFFLIYCVLCFRNPYS